MCGTVVGTIPSRLLQQRDPNIADAALNTKPTQAMDGHGSSLSNSKRPRKDRAANQLVPKMLVLIHAKRQQHIEETNTIDKRDLMTPDITKRQRISNQVNKASFSPSSHDGLACKTKQNQLVLDYKYISDYLGCNRQNIRDYWDLTRNDRKQEDLPILFSHELYAAIQEWFSNRPLINPPHLRDVFSAHDTNFLSNVSCKQQNVDSNTESEDPIQLAQRQVLVPQSSNDT